jgi:methylthioribose-1-phosphate isomerase
MPAGAERTVLRVLSYHIGLKNAIQKPDLMSECAKAGAHFKDERQVRKAIVDLRKRGVPACSSSGDSGYFLAASLAEYQEFRGREYVKKITDMKNTVLAMDEQARQMFAAEYREYKRAQAERAGQPMLLEA